MYEEKTHTLFIKYAVPQMIGLLFNSVYLIVDGIFIGNRLGRDAMAAAAVAVPFIEILIALSMAVASGASITISNRLGCKKMDAARQTFGLAALILSVISITIAVLDNIIHPLATLLGSTPKKALLIALLRSIIMPPILITVLPLIFGSEIIWICHSLSEMITAGFAFFILRYENNPNNK